jgi:hypothetical protein
MRLLALSSLFALSACGGESGEIWLFSVDSKPASECSSTVIENYTVGDPPSGTTSGFWEYTEDIVTSPTMVFGQLLTTTGGEAVLIIGGKTYTGEKVKGTWEFSYDLFTDGTDSQRHATGYEFASNGRDSLMVAITANIKGAKMTGTWSTSTSVDVTYTETDEWDVTSGIMTGQSPAADYLVDNMGVWVINSPNEDDCTGDTCSLQIIETCASASSFTAVKVDAHQEGAFAALEDAGQQPGAE